MEIHVIIRLTSTATLLVSHLLEASGSVEWLGAFAE